ncbi:MAG TPA: 50S ribosomal protein L5 [Candidatus Nanoarchaeia archaeon]|nr:50S ribosomal protein L5 [Candidatus Nanoarchaeia archaeon]
MATKENPMRTIRVEKLTLNIGAGKEQSVLDKGTMLLKNITGIDPVKTVTQKRIPTWGVRPGLPIGCKITLRGKKALALIPSLLDAKSNKLLPSCFDENGSVSFGIHEYIDIKGVKYDPKIGIMGLQVCITLERPGFRIKRRRKAQRKIPPAHKINKQEAEAFMKQAFNTALAEE